MSLSVKKGDTVLVLAGKDKGKVGKVNLVNPSDKRVVVEGVNVINKHQKPKNAQDKGGIIKKEGTIDISNVQVICASCNKTTRVAHTFVEGKKVRVCKHCGASLDTSKKVVKKAPAKKTSAAKKPAESN
jgi:large subunit ribosomal protein L24